MTGDLLLCHSLAFEKYVSSKQTDPRSVGMTSGMVQEADLNLF